MSGPRLPAMTIPVALALVVALLSGCGFKPVSSAALPFPTLYVSAGSYASFGGEFRRFVESNSRTTTLADTPGGADAVLEILGERQEKQILSLSSAGRVREYLLRYQVSFRLKDRSGRELIPADTIVLERDLTYDDDAVLAKENEEIFLYRDMQADAVQQLVRRLSVADFNAAPAAAGG
jgi:LPS-assembly lipoprotein